MRHPVTNWHWRLNVQRLWVILPASTTEHRSITCTRNHRWKGRVPISETGLQAAVPRPGHREGLWVGRAPTAVHSWDDVTHMLLHDKTACNLFFKWPLSRTSELSTVPLEAFYTTSRQMRHLAVRALSAACRMAEIVVS